MRPLFRFAVELRLGKQSGGLAKNLVGPLEFEVLPLQAFEFVAFICRLIRSLSPNRALPGESTAGASRPCSRFFRQSRRSPTTPNRSGHAAPGPSESLIPRFPGCNSFLGSLLHPLKRGSLR